MPGDRAYVLHHVDSRLRDLGVTPPSCLTELRRHLEVAYQLELPDQGWSQIAIGEMLHFATWHTQSGDLPGHDGRDRWLDGGASNRYHDL
jgi:hypothetical protein